MTSQLRQALGAHLGLVLTPEVAAAVEIAAGAVVPRPTENLPDFIDPATGGFQIASEGPQAIRAWVLTLAKEMLAAPASARIEPELKHTFLNGIYMREMFIPKGALIVGRIHKQSCMNVVSKGDISILTEAGTARVKAGHSAVSLPGTQKVGYAHEDTVFINVFRTDETDVSLVEDVIAFSEQQCLSLLEQPARRLI